jgi:hypothetical protein
MYILRSRKCLLFITIESLHVEGAAGKGKRNSDYQEEAFETKFKLKRGADRDNRKPTKVDTCKQQGHVWGDMGADISRHCQIRADRRGQAEESRVDDHAQRGNKSQRWIARMRA